MTREPPQRRITDHFHSDVWTRAEQHRYEDRIDGDMDQVQKKLDQLSNRITLMLGGIALLVFTIPVIAPFVRSALNLP